MREREHIQPFEGYVTVVNGILRSDEPELDGLLAWSWQTEGASYYIHAEYAWDGEVLVRNYEKQPN
jgi:hypothetical protein